MNHPRRFRFQFSPCAVVCPEENADQTNVIIFINNYKLRAHAIGHFVNTEEMKHWATQPAWNLNVFGTCIDRLKDLGCPFFDLNMGHLPPCNDTSFRCPLAVNCGEVVTPLEEAYSQAIQKIIDETGNLPRYSRFADRQNGYFCWLFSNQSILIKMVWSHDVYNVMTAYKPRQGGSLPFKAILSHTVSRIQSEAGAQLIWCDQTTWGLDQGDPENDPLQKENRKKQKTAGRPGRYIRGGGQNWRQYLNQEQA
jgi:hypothetical protein